MVLPSGDVVTASANDHPDLFWALRGGGGGNFGVTTSMTFATFATGDSDVVRLDFPPSSAVQVLAGWQSWLTAADRNTWEIVDLSVGSQPGGKMRSLAAGYTFERNYYTENKKQGRVLSATDFGRMKSGFQPKARPKVQYAITHAKPAGMMTSDSKSGER